MKSVAPNFFSASIVLQWHMGARFVAYVLLYPEILHFFQIQPQTFFIAPLRGGGRPPLGGKKWPKIFFLKIHFFRLIQFPLGVYSYASLKIAASNPILGGFGVIDLKSE